MEMSEGRQVRDFINVTDVAAGFVTALQREDLREGWPEIENLGSGTPRSLEEFACAQWAELGATGKLLIGALPMRDNEIMRYVPELSRT